MRKKRNALRAFLCYEQRDRSFALRLAASLRRTLGGDDAVWCATDPETVEQSSTIMRQMMGRPVFLVIVTPHAMKSSEANWLRMQTRLANRNGKLIIPIMREPVEEEGELGLIIADATLVSALPDVPLDTVVAATAALIRGEYPASPVTADAMRKEYFRYQIGHLWAPLAAALVVLLILGVVAGPTVVARGKLVMTNTYGCSMPLQLNLGGEHDLGRGQWWPAGYLQLGRQGNSALTLPSGKVLVEGGAFSQGYTNAFTRASELFDPTTCSWQSSGTLHTGRTADELVLLRNGKALAIGGYDGPVLNEAELYDPATGAWSPTGSMTALRDNMTATVLANGKVLVAGGWDNVVVESAELYDPASGRWSSAGNMTIPRTGHVAVLLPSGEVLVAGGGPINVSTTDRAELYNPVTNTWTATGSMTIARVAPGAVLLPDGKVLVAGGDTTQGSTASAELYDPATGTWSIAASMHHARQFSHQTLELLPNGTVLAVGGDAQATSEIYLPDSNTWTDPVPLGQAHCDGATALLHDGRVLVAGGDNCQSLDDKPLAAMLYTY